MRITHHLLPLMAILLLLATGCRSHKEAASTPKPNTTTHTPATPTVIDTLTTPTYSPHYYTANFTASAQGYSANGQLRIQSDSIIWLSASKVIELARARFTPDSAIIYAKVLGRAFQGSYVDLYRRFKYRTSFDELYRLVMSDDAEAQLSAIIATLGLDATVRLDPIKEVDKLSFPMALPDKVNPL